MKHKLLACLTLLFSVVVSSITRAENAATPGELLIERPTLHCLGFRWYLQGDDNRNATVAVEYREAGAGAFRKAGDLLRINGETAFQTEDENRWSAPNLFAGSIVDLVPGTRYEVQLRLTDPDGGTVERALQVGTRAVPAASTQGRTLHVYATDGNQKLEPAYIGLRAAYAAAQPGDVLLLHAGTYRVPEKEKTAKADYVFDKQASADAPIVLRAAGDGEAILDGDGAQRLIDCQRSAYHGLEGLTLQDADHGLYAGREQGAVGLWMRNCKTNDISYPLFAIHLDCQDFYIADNTFTGRKPDWNNRAEQKNESHAVWLQGQGHVICYNRISGFWDGIDLYGRVPPGETRRMNCANDFYGNLISACGDDCIELDYGAHNNRVFRNFMYNTFMGISAQPVYAGPAYIFRNVVYNSTRSPLKPNQYPAGLLVYNNTFLAYGSAGTWAPIWQNSRIVNNLLLGTGNPGRVLQTGTLTPETSQLDYNGYRWFPPKEGTPILWFTPTPVVVPPVKKPLREHSFPSFEKFTAGLGHEAHHVMVDYSDLVSAVPPTGTDVPLPQLNLTLANSSKAVDAGIAIPNITDGFRGAAPDLGAYELEDKPPHYGPRQ